jgi:hypothetical protein
LAWTPYRARETPRSTSARGVRNPCAWAPASSTRRSRSLLIGTLVERFGPPCQEVETYDEPDGIAPQEYLPESPAGCRFYRPSGRGFRSEVAKRLEAWAARRRAKQEEGNQRTDD